jgi:hypothetical protein
MNTHAPMRGAAALALAALLCGQANADSAGDSNFVRQTADEAATTPAGAPRHEPRPAAEPRVDKLPASAHARGAGILTQTDHVRIGCFPGELRGVLHQISAHFGKPVVVTSGQRSGGRRGSFHRTCMAADIQIAGVSPSAIARFARGLDAVGGVGTYGHTRSVHVDVGDRVFSWHGPRRRTAALSAGGCCPTCAAMEAAATGRRFEAVCTG